MGKKLFVPQFRKLDEILRILRETRDYARDIRGQVTGSTRLGDYPGWTMIGKTPGGKGLMYTSGLAALRHDIAAVNAKVDRIEKKVKKPIHRTEHFVRPRTLGPTTRSSRGRNRSAARNSTTQNTIAAVVQAVAQVLNAAAWECLWLVCGVEVR